MTEEGLVRALRGGEAEVVTFQTEACRHCMGKGACYALGGIKERVVSAQNPVGAAVGDRVLLAIPRSEVMHAGVLAYLVPVAALILGALVGQKTAPSLGLDPTDGSVLVGVAGLALAWLGTSLYSRRLSRKNRLRVRILRVLPPEAPPEAA